MPSWSTPTSDLEPVCVGVLARLITGKQPYMRHTGPLYPNCSTISSMTGGKGPDFIDFGVLEKKPDLGDKFYWRGDCADGCLFNVEEDPSESKDLSREPAQQERLQRMIKALAKQNQTLFMPERGETELKACYSMMLNGGGHFGPFVDIEGYYTNLPREMKDLSRHEKAQMALMAAVEKEPLRSFVQKAASKRILKKLELESDKCCTTVACHGNSTDAGLPDAFSFVQNVSASMQDAVDELGVGGYV